MTMHLTKCEFCPTLTTKTITLDVNVGRTYEDPFAYRVNKRICSICDVCFINYHNNLYTELLQDYKKFITMYNKRFLEGQKKHVEQ